MTNVNVSLPETLKDYIEEQVTDGGYGTTSEYLRELILHRIPHVFSLTFRECTW